MPGRSKQHTAVVLLAEDQGLTSLWNSAPAEGRVNHIKMIKRQMFGRAGLPLLRMLLTARDSPRRQSGDFSGPAGQ